jgi:hypothetical protein
MFWTHDPAGVWKEPVPPTAGRLQGAPLNVYIDWRRQEGEMLMLSNRSIPASTVMPVLPYSNVGEAIDWLSDVFGFTMRLRIADHRAQLNVGVGPWW